MVTGPSDNPSEGSPAPQSPEAWAETLKADWERRAQSPSRDFYVASHRGWNDEQRWQEQARVDLQSFLLELDVASLKQHHALEIGCGVGREDHFSRPQHMAHNGPADPNFIIPLASGL